MNVWSALSQIAAHWRIGFNEFEIWGGSKGQPVGMLSPDLPLTYSGPRDGGDYA